MPTSERLVSSDRAFATRESPPSSPAADYFQTARRAFAQATRGEICREFVCQMGGYTIRLQFADEALVPIVIPALAHLETASGSPPDLTIGLSDLATSGVTLDFPGGELANSQPEGAMWRHEDARFFALAQRETDSLSLFDAAEKQAFYWAREARRMPWYEGSFPLRHLLAHFFRRQRQHVVHAAAVGDERGAVLIVGKGGSGKSTSTLACATHGLSYLGDDYTLVGLEPAPVVWSMYSSAKVNADSLDWFPQLRPCVHHAGGADEKSSLLLKGAPGFSFARSAPVRAVLWPRITGREETALTPTSPTTMLLALAPSSILQTPGGGDAVLRTLGQLVQTVPTLILEAGTEPTGIAATIKDFLAR